MFGYVLNCSDMGQSLHIIIGGDVKDVDFLEDIADAKEPVGVGGLRRFLIEVLFKAEKLLIVHVIPLYLLDELLVVGLKHLLLNFYHRVAIG